MYFLQLVLAAFACACVNGVNGSALELSNAAGPAAKALYGAALSMSLSRWHNQDVRRHQQTREYKQQAKPYQRAIAWSAPGSGTALEGSSALRQLDSAARVRATKNIGRMVLYGVLLRGAESAWQQATNTTSTIPVPVARGLVPRHVEFGTAGAVISLASALVGPWFGGLVAALHVGFHGSGGLWKALATFK